MFNATLIHGQIVSSETFIEDPLEHLAWSFNIPSAAVLTVGAMEILGLNLGGTMYQYCTNTTWWHMPTTASQIMCLNIGSYS